MSSRSYVEFVAACAVALSLGLPAPARADSQSDCQWAINDPDRVVDSCTTLLAAQKAPKAWMHFNRGLAFKVLGRLEEAERDYSRAIELDRKHSAAYTNRGNVRLLRNNAEGALADYRAALKLDPKDQVARQNLKAVQDALRRLGADKSGRGVSSGTAR